MAKSISLYQIYYKDEQKEQIYDFAIPYFNTVLTPYFENAVISELVPKSNADFISVCSWRLKKKRGDCFRLPDKTLTLEKIENADFDIAILTPRSPTHDVMGMAAHWHGKAWTDAIEELKKKIKIPKKVNYAIYENHFIARKDIYSSYVLDCLNPCIEFMHTNSVFHVDSGYNRRKSKSEVLEYEKKTGRKDWPISPFVLERLFSIYINDKDFKVINL